MRESREPRRLQRGASFIVAFPAVYRDSLANGKRYNGGHAGTKRWSCRYRGVASLGIALVTSFVSQGCSDKETLWRKGEGGGRERVTRARDRRARERQINGVRTKNDEMKRKRERRKFVRQWERFSVKHPSLKSRSGDLQQISNLTRDTKESLYLKILTRSSVVNTFHSLEILEIEPKCQISTLFASIFSTFYRYFVKHRR